jgi:hypothetical protein
MKNLCKCIWALDCYVEEGHNTYTFYKPEYIVEVNMHVTRMTQDNKSQCLPLGTLVATQLKLTILLQLVIMVKLRLIIIVYILCTYICVESKLQLMCN